MGCLRTEDGKQRTEDGGRMTDDGGRRTAGGFVPSVFSLLTSGLQIRVDQSQLDGKMDQFDG